MEEAWTFIFISAVAFIAYKVFLQTRDAGTPVSESKIRSLMAIFPNERRETLIAALRLHHSSLDLAIQYLLERQSQPSQNLPSDHHSKSSMSLSASSSPSTSSSPNRTVLLNCSTESSPALASHLSGTANRSSSWSPDSSVREKALRERKQQAMETARKIFLEKQ